MHVLHMPAAITIWAVRLYDEVSRFLGERAVRVETTEGSGRFVEAPTGNWRKNSATGVVFGGVASFNCNY